MTSQGGVRCRRANRATGCGADGGAVADAQVQLVQRARSERDRRGSGGVPPSTTSAIEPFTAAIPNVGVGTPLIETARPSGSQCGADIAVASDRGHDVGREFARVGSDEVVPDDPCPRRRLCGVDETGAEREATHDTDHAAIAPTSAERTGTARSAAWFHREPRTDQLGAGGSPARKVHSPTGLDAGASASPRATRHCAVASETEHDETSAARRGRVPPNRHACRCRDRAGARIRSGTAMTTPPPRRMQCTLRRRPSTSSATPSRRPPCCDRRPSRATSGGRRRRR